MGALSFRDLESAVSTTGTGVTTAAIVVGGDAAEPISKEQRKKLAEEERLRRQAVQAHPKHGGKDRL